MKRPAEELWNVVSITLGVFSAGMGLHGFLLSSGFIDGGVTGISMLLANRLHWPLSVLVPVLNLPFIALGDKHLGRPFAIRSALAIFGLSVVLATVHYPDLTHDNLLSAVFGGFFIGAGIGLAMRGGAVLDGTDIAALLLSKRSSLFKVGDVILGLNIVIFVLAAFFLGIDKALYSIVTYYAASKTLDFLLHGIEQYTAITIVSERNDAIRLSIVETLNRGVTVYKGKGGKRGVDIEILYCVVTRLEIGKVKAIARDVDESAFVIIQPLADVEGGFLKKKSLH